MRLSRGCTSYLCLLAGVVLFAVPAAAKDQPECGKVNVSNAAINCPDMFAWQKFAEVVAPADGTVAFLTYSSDPETFQCPPADLKTCKANPQAKGCPVWPAPPTAASSAAVVKVSAGTQRSARLRFLRRSGIPQDDCWNYYNNNAVEIVYRNKATFDYIVAHGLWYVEGVERAFENGFVYDFPVQSLEVKTNWLPLSPAQVQSGRFFTMTSGGQTLGLVSMHISSKDLPNWFWSTFEHVDNLGRCDFLGCHDSFGYTPHDIPSRPKELCGQYPGGEITPELKAILSKVSPVFQYYRLKGSMTDYTDATGTPNLLGNSVTEAGFVPTASCMTCHARATVQATAGAPNGLSPYPNVAGFTASNQSYHGTPDPNWYYSNNNPIIRWSVQSDFVWAIPFKANSLHATAQCCQNGAPSGPPACQCQAAGVCQ